MAADVSTRMMHVGTRTYLVRLEVHVVVPDLVNKADQVDKGHVVLIRRRFGLHELYGKTKETSGFCIRIGDGLAACGPSGFYKTGTDCC